MNKKVRIALIVLLSAVIVGLMFLGWVTRRDQADQPQSESVRVETESTSNSGTQSSDATVASLDDRCVVAEEALEAYLLDDREALMVYVSDLGKDWAGNAPKPMAQTITGETHPVSNYLGSVEGGCEASTNLGKWLIRVSRPTTEDAWKVDAILPGEITMITDEGQAQSAT